MFSGIVRRLGVVVAREPRDFGQWLQVDPGPWDHRTAAGESIAINGCCLTVTGHDGPAAGRGDLCFDVIRQTLNSTTLGDLHPGDRVNVEPAVTPATMLSGHLVQGHVDGVGTITRVAVDEADERLRVEPPAGLAEYIIEKGSIAINGVSLTVAEVGEEWFEVALIPTTIRETNLGAVKQGDRVNLETDYVVKTIVSWLRRSHGHER